MSHGCGLHCLKIEHISVKDGQEEILHDVCLHAHCGELTAIIGRNGAGKSTLLKAILGEMKHEGTVTFSGHNGTPTPHKPKIGYVPQHLDIDKTSPATVFDMALAFTSHRPAFLPPKKAQVASLRSHFERFGAGDLLEKRAGVLSGGELQRVLLAIATIPAPDLLILDEPVSGVDAAGLDRFYGMVETLRRTDDMVMLLVSHDLDFVKRAAGRVVLLDKTVKAVGTPNEVFASEAFATAFPKGGA